MSLWKRLFGKKDSGNSKTRSEDKAADMPEAPPAVPPEGGPHPSEPDSKIEPPQTPEPPTETPPLKGSEADLTAADRHVRVFISSTFRDMMRERDLLVKEVFPELRRKCDSRFVTFTEVDLRWGITEAQANEGQVLPLCLAEIEHSRPYFLGLLGERYGWIPDSIRPEVIEREPWLAEHVLNRTSVTELEILHGVLNDPEMRGLAFFYFRDPGYVRDAMLSDDERRDMIEHDFPGDISKYGEAEASRRTQERRARLAALKQRIRDSGLPLVETYANPKVLASIVLKQFDELIDRLFPEDLTPDPLTQERHAHEAHARQKLFACIDRPAHLAVLNAFVASTEHKGKGLVVTGESGGGKSTLLAAWARNWAAAHPDDFLFQHFFGATEESASPEGFLRRLLGELKGHFGITEEIPLDAQKLREALPRWLAQTVGRGRIVLVFDGLNQVQGGEADRRLRFLPSHFPPHVVALASALPGPGLEALRAGGWIEHELPQATAAEVDAMVSKYLEIHARTLEPALRNQMVAAPGVKTPLFLRSVLEELRQFGRFEQLPVRVAYYLEAGEPKGLFLRILRRWQEDFDGRDLETEQPKCDLVRRTLTHLWAARHGLSEPEWLDLLGNLDGPLPRAFWTPLFLALEPHMSRHAGLFTFGHDFLRQAVEEAFVSDWSVRQLAHLTLADYFEKQQGMSSRKSAEWPYQLQAAESWDRLEACLTNLPLFLALFNNETQWELTGYWHPLRNLDRDMGHAYTSAFNRWIEDPVVAENLFVVNELGMFLVKNGLYPSAEPLLHRSLVACERVLGSEHPNTLVSAANLALLLYEKGDAEGAEPLGRRVLDARERILGLEHPDTLLAMDCLAGMLDNKGDLAGSESIYRRVLDARERILGPEHPQTLTTVNNLASVLYSKGDIAGAEPLFRRALASHEYSLGPEHPDVANCLLNLASCLKRKGDLAGAELLNRRAMEVFERVLGPEHPITLLSLNNLAQLLKSKGDRSGAELLNRRAMEICERVLGPEHPITLGIVNNLAEYLQDKYDFAGAEPLFHQVFETRERVQGPEHNDTLQSLNNLAFFLLTKGDCPGAAKFFHRALDILEKRSGGYNPVVLAAIKRNLPELCRDTSCLSEAEQLHRRFLAIEERILGKDHPDLAISLGILAAILQENNHLAEAEQLLLRRLEIFLKSTRATGHHHPQLQDALGDYGALLRKMGLSLENVMQRLFEIARPYGIKFG